MLRLNAHKEIAASLSPSPSPISFHLWTPFTALRSCKALREPEPGAGGGTACQAPPPHLQPNHRASLEVIFYIVFRFYRAAFDKEKTDALLRCVQHDSFIRRKENPKGYTVTYPSHLVLQFWKSWWGKEKVFLNYVTIDIGTCFGLINFVISP